MAEAPTMEMRARLTADTASFTKGMAEANRTVNDFIGQSSKLQAAMVGAGVAAGAIGAGLIGFATKSFQAAARVDELDVALQAVGASSGLTYEKLDATRKGIQSMGIEVSAAQEAVLKMAQNQVDLAKGTELAAAAQDYAVISHQNSTETFNQMIAAIQSQNSQALRNIGITTTAGQAMEEYARANNKSAQSLSNVEKKQAIVDAILNDAKRVAGTYKLAMETPGKVLRSFARLNEWLMVSVGQIMLKGFGPLIFQTYELYKKFTLAVMAGGNFKKVIDVLTKIVIALTKPVTDFVSKLGTWIDNFDKLNINSEKLMKTLQFILPAILAVGSGLATMAGKQLLGMLPVVGRLVGFLNPWAVGFMVLAATSLKVRAAIGNLLSALTPFLGVLKTVVGFIANMGGYAVGLFAKAINGLAAGIRTVTSFFQQHAAAAKILAIALGAVAAAVLATVIYLQAQKAIAAVSAAVMGAYTFAMIAFGFAEAGAAAGGVLLTAQMQALAIAMAETGIPEIVLGIVALVAAFAYAWKTSETFREVVKNVFNTVAATIGKALAFVFKFIGYTLIAFGNLIDVNNWFGKTVAAVFQFVWGAVLTVFIGIVKLVKWVIDAFIGLMENQGILGQVIETVINFVIKAYILWVKTVLTAVKNVLDAFVNLMEGHETVRKIVETVFNVIMRIVAFAVTSIIVSFANIIKGIATLIRFFEVLLEAAKDIVVGIIGAFFWLGKGILGLLGKVATNIGDFLKESLATVKGWVTGFLGLLMRIPPISALVNAAFNGMATATTVAVDALKTVGNKIADVFTGTSDPAQKSVDAITGVSQSLIDGSKAWGNYSSGVSGALSGIANKMLGFSQSVVDFTAKDNGALIVANLIKGAKASSEVLGTVIDKLKEAEQINFGKAVVDTLVAGAKMASSALGKVIDEMEKMKDIKVGEFIVDKTSEAAIKAGEFLVGLAGNIEQFTSGDVLGKFTGAIGDFFSSMKENLGFGDILERAKASLTLGTPQDDKLAKDIQANADRMKAIKDAMAQGIDSIKQVLQDLQQASKDFANSLKDTIVGFAGLKGVELPDGFIPKAKSLIENMRTRLDKSQQFATQIAQLQAQGLDASALKQIIEEGPIKGSQLAASILGGNAAENISQINALQRAIQFTGAAIGQYGADAAYSGLIANAQKNYAQMVNDQLNVKSAGNNITIDQGAFVVNVDVSSAKGNTEEQIKLITDAIQYQFQILAKELAAK